MPFIGLFDTQSKMPSLKKSLKSNKWTVLVVQRHTIYLQKGHFDSSWGPVWHVIPLFIPMFPVYIATVMT